MKSFNRYIPAVVECNVVCCGSDVISFTASIMQLVTIYVLMEGTSVRTSLLCMHANSPYRSSHNASVIRRLPVPVSAK